MVEITFGLICVGVIALLILLTQLLLCFKTKTAMVKFIPMAALLGLASVSVICAGASDGWHAVGFILLHIAVLFWLLICGIGWLLWLVVQFIKA